MIPLAAKNDADQAVHMHSDLDFAGVIWGISHVETGLILINSFVTIARTKYELLQEHIEISHTTCIVCFCFFHKISRTLQLKKKTTILSSYKLTTSYSLFSFYLFIYLFTYLFIIFSFFVRFFLSYTDPILLPILHS